MREKLTRKTADLMYAVGRPIVARAYGLATIVYLGVFALWMAATVVAITWTPGPLVALQGLLGSILVVVCVRRGTRMLVRRKLHRIQGLLPRVIDGRRNDDGTVTCTVTRQNGDLTTLVLPEDYDPADDRGELIFRHLLPAPEFEEFQRHSQAVVDQLWEDG